MRGSDFDFLVRGLAQGGHLVGIYKAKTFEGKEYVSGGCANWASPTGKTTTQQTPVCEGEVDTEYAGLRVLLGEDALAFCTPLHFRVEKKGWKPGDQGHDKLPT